MQSLPVHALGVILEPESVILLTQLLILFLDNKLVLSVLLGDLFGLLNNLLINLQLRLKIDCLLFPLDRERLEFVEALQLQLGILLVLQVLGLMLTFELFHLAQQLLVSWVGARGHAIQLRQLCHVSLATKSRRSVHLRVQDGVEA